MARGPAGDDPGPVRDGPSGGGRWQRTNLAALLRARAGVGARAGAREHRRRGHRTHALCDELGEGRRGRARAQTGGRLPRRASPVGRHPSAWVASGPLGGRTGGTVGGRARRLALRHLPASIHRAFGPAVPPPSGYGSVGTWRIGATPEPRPGRTRRPSGPQRAVPAPGTRDAARRPHDQARSRRGHDLPAGGRPRGGGALGGRPTARRWTGRTQGGVARGLGYRPGLGRTPERSSQQLPTGRPTPRGDSLPVTFATSGAGDGGPALSWGWRSPRRPRERAGPGNPAGPNLPADRRTARRVHPKDLLLHTGGIPPPRTVRGENDPRRPGVGTRVGDCMPAQAPPSSIPTPAPPHWLPARVRSPPAARRGSDQLVVDARTRRARATIRVPTSHADAAPTSGAFYSFVVGLVVPRLFQR